MHAKLFIIEFDDFIRIVVSSANLTDFDWSFFKQCIWIQDFPKKENISNNNTNQFENTLVEFWTKLTDGIPGNFLRKYDYSNAKGELIPSIPGYHTNIEKDKYGHLAIKKAIERMNFTKNEILNLKQSPLYYQMSSIGSMNLDWIKELSSSFYLKDCNNFNIVFPSLESVSSSHFGLRCGGMIHLKSKTFETSTFPKHLMTHYSPNQANHLAHSKILLHLENLKNGYIFVGSHNLSQPALGKLQKNGTQLYISNYELGVIFKLNNFNSENNLENNSQEKEVNNENLDKYCKLNLPFKIPTKRMDLKHDSPFILETVQDLLD
ncbi:predicted protein [Naegleria gruberi]|uniref:Predicted protein n=1 Tax=Naegleria gruberi TaxID=5762 RepID=D2V0L4_NAEGR|nr:uncharacterized protein NAEGRDRAFT_62335 [Naegleria gruberi]EFC49742.1 predicted protein [Naegleria gruberi]|eukprot:XP_002682486.1 predicted protein [Naegleria gruberi strain NEG-M]